MRNDGHGMVVMGGCAERHFTQLDTTSQGVFGQSPSPICSMLILMQRCIVQIFSILGMSGEGGSPLTQARLDDVAESALKQMGLILEDPHDADKSDNGLLGFADSY
eukprot:m.1194729 g.1194729  ORF g.1194729 m.1194729 type:complete len:106 (-) comp24562_c1_seq28:3246-3563(-)